jgi:pentatricopeptide repeat protein
MPPAARPDVHDSAGDGDDALHTNTLAELYLRQGLVDKAVEVYRSMLRVDPDNQKAARRLADLEPAGAPPAAPAPLRSAPVIERPEPIAASRARPAVPAMPPTGPVARAKDHRIDRLERWLERMRSGIAREANPR